MKSDVFNRTSNGETEISPRLYNLTIGLVLSWGFLVNWFMVDSIPVEAIASIHPWVFIGGFLVSGLVGICMFNMSSNPLISFIGYNFLVVPFGLVINLAVANYNPTIVLDAIQVTGLVTGLMMFLGTLFPAFFLRLGGMLCIALLCLLGVELFQIFVLKKSYGWTDWIAVAIFSGYIAYDWARANHIPHTLDNAVDSAAALYMDIINLFLRVLRLLGNKD